MSVVKDEPTGQVETLDARNMRLGIDSEFD